MTFFVLLVGNLKKIQKWVFFKNIKGVWTNHVLKHDSDFNIFFIL